MVAVGSADAERGSILQGDFAIAIGQGADAGDAIEADDCGAMNAEESCGLERAFEGIERLANQVRFRVDVNFRVAALGLNPVDVFDCDEAHLPADLDGEFANGAPARIGALIHQRLNSLVVLGGGIGCQDAAGVMQGRVEAGIVNGLEQIVDGMHFKCAHHVLVERGDKNDEGLGVANQRPDDVDAVHHRHLNVEKH